MKDFVLLPDLLLYSHLEHILFTRSGLWIQITELIVQNKDWYFNNFEAHVKTKTCVHGNMNIAYIISFYWICLGEGCFIHVRTASC